MDFPSLPKSSTAVFLPHAAGWLHAQLDEMNAEDGKKVTFTQQAVAKLTATVAVAAFAFADALFHTTCAVLKAVPTLVKVTVAKWTGLDKHMSKALDGKEWCGHVENVYKNTVMAAFALGVGPYDPRLVAGFGSTIGLMKIKDKDEPIFQVGGSTPSAAAAGSV